jgi:hypothetical protein
MEASLAQLRLETGVPLSAHPTFLAISTSGNRQMTVEQDNQRIEIESLNTELANTGNILRDLTIEFNEAVEALAQRAGKRDRAPIKKTKVETKITVTPQQKSPGALNYLSSAGLDDISDDEDDHHVVQVIRKRKTPTDHK